MPTFFEFSRPRLAAPTQPGWTWPLALLGLFFINGCAVLEPTNREASARVQGTLPSSAPAHAATPLPASGSSAPIATPALATAPVPGAAPSQPDLAVVALSLAGYAERLRTMPTTELAAELARLGPSPAPQSQLQFALALAQMQQLPELIRAQETVARVLANSTDEAKALHPVAKLLAVRFSEARRLEDLLDKQNQQIKDLQRRLDQTSERLEALKAIERSLVSRPAPVRPSVTPPTPSTAQGRISPQPAGAQP